MAIRITVVVPLFDSMGHGNAFLFMHRTQFLRRMRPCIGVLDVLHVWVLLFCSSVLIFSHVVLRLLLLSYPLRSSHWIDGIVQRATNNKFSHAVAESLFCWTCVPLNLCPSSAELEWMGPTWIHQHLIPNYHAPRSSANFLVRSSLWVFVPPVTYICIYRRLGDVGPTSKSFRVVPRNAQVRPRGLAVRWKWPSNEVQPLFHLPFCGVGLSLSSCEVKWQSWSMLINLDAW